MRAGAVIRHPSPAGSIAGRRYTALLIYAPALHIWPVQRAGPPAAVDPPVNQSGGPPPGGSEPRGSFRFAQARFRNASSRSSRTIAVAAAAARTAASVARRSRGRSDITRRRHNGGTGTPEAPSLAADQAPSQRAAAVLAAQQAGHCPASALSP